jgi:hypothetical protein
MILWRGICNVHNNDFDGKFSGLLPTFFWSIFGVYFSSSPLNCFNKLFMSSNKYLRKCRILIETKLIFISSDSYIFSNVRTKFCIP